MVGGGGGGGEGVFFEEETDFVAGCEEVGVADVFRRIGVGVVAAGCEFGHGVVFEGEVVE